MHVFVKDYLRRFLPHTILLVAFALRIVNIIGESLWRDEVDSVRFAFEPLGDILRNFTANGFNGPLYHLSLRAWLSLAGISDFALRYFSLMCGMVLVALVYALSHRLFGRRAALAAMWLTTISPVLAWYASEGKMYSLQPMLLVLALYALVRACGWRRESGEWRVILSSSPLGREVRRGGNARTPLWWLAFALSTSLSFYTHLLSPIFLAIAVAFFLAQWPQSRAHLKGGLIALAALTLPYLPLAIWQLPALIRGGDVGHTYYPLDIIARTLFSNWTVGLDGHAPLLNVPSADATVDIVRWLVMALFVALALYGLVDGADGADGADGVNARLRWAVLAWLVLPLMIVFLVSTRFPIFQPRYVLWSAPALFVLAGLGWSRLSRMGRSLRWVPALMGGLLTLVCLSSWVSQVINPIRPDLRGAATFMAQTAQPGDVLVFQIPYGQHSFTYYAARNNLPTQALRIIEAPFTNYGTSDDEVSINLLDSVGEARRVWLFETEAEMWDNRALVRAWFDRDAQLIDRRDFRGVSVGLYELP